MARLPDPSTSRTIEMDGGSINIRREPHGGWTISLDFDLAKYPKARAAVVENTPPTISADSMDAMTAWARAEWELRKGPAARRP